jgi:hypothetical protein
MKPRKLLSNNALNRGSLAVLVSSRPAVLDVGRRESAPVTCENKGRRA